MAYGPVNVSTDNELTKEEILNKINVLDIEHGGTGKATKKEAFYNLAFLGNNPISSTNEDTTQKWSELGSGYAWFYTNGLMINQPYSYMFVISYYNKDSNSIFQIGSEQTSGTVYYRTGNSSGWLMNWTPLLSTKGGTMSGQIYMNNQGIIFNKDADWGNGNYFSINAENDSLKLQMRRNGVNRLFYFNDNATTIDKALQMWWYDDGKEHSSRFFGEHNTSLLATTIQNLIDKGEIHMEKQYIISDSGMTTETFANNVSCIGLQDDSVKVLGKFIPQHDGTILVQTKATNSSDARELSLYYTAMHTGSRYGGFDRYRAKNSGIVNTAISQKATMFFDNVKIPAGTILTGKYSFLIYESVELNSWAKKQTSYSYMVLTVQKNRPVTFYCDSSNSFSDSGLTNITLQIMYKVV